MAANAVPRVRRKERPDGLLLPRGCRLLGRRASQKGSVEPKEGSSSRGRGATSAKERPPHATDVVVCRLKWRLATSLLEQDGLATGG